MAQVVPRMEDTTEAAGVPMRVWFVSAATIYVSAFNMPWIARVRTWLLGKQPDKLAAAMQLQTCQHWQHCMCR
jgi:hypothetical protein